LRADARPAYGTFAPVGCPNGVAAFARDPDVVRKVWSATDGYPGDPWYREYYRDIGFELPADALGYLAAPPGSRGPTGIKYHRVTGRTEDKQPYDPSRAREQASAHARDFLRDVAARCRIASPAMERPPLVTAPFDAELFGHWWHEGPVWLEEVVRGAAASGVVETIAPDAYLDRHPRLQRATPAESSWGEGGGHETWLNEDTLWIWTRLHDSARRLEHWEAGGGAPDPDDRCRRQAARHLLLAQASDWPFMIRHGRAADVAERIARDHLDQFDYLEAAAREGRIDDARIGDLERQMPIFSRRTTNL